MPAKCRNPAQSSLPHTGKRSQPRINAGIHRRTGAQSFMDRDFDRDDYTVVVKLRADSATPWKWEIYRAGNRLPVERSPTFFPTPGTAYAAGKEALARFVDKLTV